MLEYVVIAIAVIVLIVVRNMIIKKYRERKKK